MATFRYRRIAIKNGTLIHEEVIELTGAELYLRDGSGLINETTFLRLLDRWNRQGIQGIYREGPVYVYHTA